MNTVTAKIDQTLLSAVLGKISVSGTHGWSGKIDIPLLPPELDPKWSVTVRFSVTNLRAVIDNQVKVFAKVHVDANLISYTDEVEAQVNVFMDGSQLIVRLKSLHVAVYVAPLGNRIDLGDVDVCSLLPFPIESPPLDILPKPYTRSLPQNLGGANLTMTVTNPQLRIQSGYIEASVDLAVS